MFSECTAIVENESVMQIIRTYEMMMKKSMVLFIDTADYKVLFDLILYVPSTIFQLNRDGASWVEPVLS